MHLGIFSKTMAGTDPTVVFERCRHAGYEVVQFNWTSAGLGPLPAEIPSSAIETVRAACDRSGILIAAISGTYNMIHPNSAERNRGAEALQAVIRSAAALRASCVTLCTGTFDASDPWKGHPNNNSGAAWSALCASLEPALATAEAEGVNLGVEPEPGNVVNSAEKARILISEMGSERLKIVFDPANLVQAHAPEAWNVKIERDLDLLAGNVVIAHAKDRAADGAIRPVGAGAIDFRQFLAGLKAQGVNAPLITHGLEAHDAPGVAQYLTAILEEMGW